MQKHIGIRIWFSLIAIAACLSGAVLFITGNSADKLVGIFFFLLGIFLLGVFWISLIKNLNINKKTLLSFLLLCTSIGFLVGGIYSLIPRIYTVITGEHIPAKIEGFSQQYSNDLTTINPLPNSNLFRHHFSKPEGIAYVKYNINGKEYLSSLNHGSSAYSYGQSIEVAYLPNTPEIVYPYGIESFLGPFIITITGLGTFFLWIHIKRRTK